MAGISPTARNMGFVIKSREDSIHAQWKGHNIASGPCNRKLHV